jgi:FkbH-like protein
MKVLIISDITLESLSRKQLGHSTNNYSFIFTEDLLYELDNTGRFDNYDIIYVHFDCYFKKYRRDYISILLNSILNLSNKLQKIIALSNLFFAGWTQKSLIDSGGAFSTSIKDFDAQIDILLKKQNVYLFDIDNLIREIGLSQTYNYSLGHLYQLPYTKAFLEKFALYLDQIVLKISSPDKKVIVLDCDNTLWRGIVGEDGVDGVVCDLNSDGIVFYHFQQFIKSRKAMGFILCICSKNNEADVKEVFVKNRMPLEWDDFVVKKVNWGNKDISIKEIAKELSLGTDSFIFIDDNEFEINIVKESLPDVSLFKMTTDYHNFIEITKSPLFSKKSITSEDFLKTEQYITEAKRKGLEESSLNFSDYIKSLEIVIKIDENLETDLLRVSQLTEKTNQFNFNKKFYSTEELRVKLLEGQFKCFTLRVSDKFGDYGLVGVILVEIINHKVVLENYILSCRILGRRIEFDFLDHVKFRISDIYKRSIDEIRFTKTPRNIPAQNFFNQIEKKYEL